MQHEQQESTNKQKEREVSCIFHVELSARLHHARGHDASMVSSLEGCVLEKGGPLENRGALARRVYTAAQMATVGPEADVWRGTCTWALRPCMHHKVASQRSFGSPCLAWF